MYCETSKRVKCYMYCETKVVYNSLVSYRFSLFQTSRDIQQWLMNPTQQTWHPFNMKKRLWIKFAMMHKLYRSLAILFQKHWKVSVFQFNTLHHNSWKFHYFSVSCVLTASGTRVTCLPLLELFRRVSHKSLTFKVFFFLCVHIET